MNNKNEDSRILKCQHVSLEVSDVNVDVLDPTFDELNAIWKAGSTMKMWSDVRSD